MSSDRAKDAAVKAVFERAMAKAEAAWLRYSDEERTGFTRHTWITGYLAGALEEKYSGR